MTWDTILAYNALADTVGAARLVKDNGWTLAKDAYVWLDGQSVTIRSCVAGVGASIDVKSELLTTDSQSQSVSVTCRRTRWSQEIGCLTWTVEWSTCRNKRR